MSGVAMGWITGSGRVKRLRVRPIRRHTGALLRASLPSRQPGSCLSATLLWDARDVELRINGYGTPGRPGVVARAVRHGLAVFCGPTAAHGRVVVGPMGATPMPLA